MYSDFIVLPLGNDRHPHRLRRPRESIQTILDRVAQAEHKGLAYQAAMLMKEIVRLHAFDGGNHRTTFVVAWLFLKQNSRSMRIKRFTDAYAFVRDLETKTIEQVQEWIQHGSACEPR